MPVSARILRLPELADGIVRIGGAGERAALVVHEGDEVDRVDLRHGLQVVEDVLDAFVVQVPRIEACGDFKGAGRGRRGAEMPWQRERCRARARHGQKPAARGDRGIGSEDAFLHGLNSQAGLKGGFPTGAIIPTACVGGLGGDFGVGRCPLGRRKMCILCGI